MRLKEMLAGKMMGNMSSEEKEKMMGRGGPMGMMMDMMGCRSGKKKDGETSETTWEMCKKMMASMTKTSEPAAFAVPEVRGLFEEWAAQIEEEILQFIDQSGSNDAAKIGEHFKLSTDSVTFFITRLANKGKINLKAEKNQ